MSGRLEARAAIITGAAQGIGRAMAIRFAAEGAPIWAVDLPKQKGRLDDIVNLIRAHGGTAAAIEADITASIGRDAILLAVSSPGPFPSILVNNAGTQFVASCLATEPEDLERLFAVHLTAAYQLTRSLAARWVADGTAGAVVNVASVAGQIHFAGLSAYSTAKAGVRGMTGGLARDLARYGIRVNAVAPGHVDTEMSQVSGDPARLAERLSTIPAGRLGQPEDIAAVAAYLASNEAAYITGQTLSVDGGLTLT